MSPQAKPVMDLVNAALEGNRLALARLLTHVENNSVEGRTALNYLFPLTGQAHLIGVTGAPGTGKSSLVNHIARAYRSGKVGLEGRKKESPRVAIVAVDPTSPFSGGAILGDRVRMRDLAGDPGVFIRSMATRGSLGGLAGATAGMCQVLDALGYGIILIETVGAGQAEIDIARLAHTTLVVEAPGLGDDIQAIKAGILEIADILVINKSDRPGVEAAERALRSMLQLAHPIPHVFRHHGKIEVASIDGIKHQAEIWLPPIMRTVAIEGTGVEDLVMTIGRHYTHLHQTGEWEQRDRTRLQAELNSLLQDALLMHWRNSLIEGHYAAILDRVLAREISPWDAVDNLLGMEII